MITLIFPRLPLTPAPFWVFGLGFVSDSGFVCSPSDATLYDASEESLERLSTDIASHLPCSGCVAMDSLQLHGLFSQ